MFKLNYLLIASVILSFLFPAPGLLAKDIILFVLAGSLFFSMINSKNVCSFKIPAILDIVPGFLYHYLFFSSMLIIFALTLPPGLRDGLILYAICPPAIGMIVLSKEWGGNYRNVFSFQLVSYFASIFLIPAASLFLFGESVDSILLIEILAIVFGLPAILTYAIKMENTNLASDLANLLLALVFYISLSVAMEGIVNGFSELAVVSVVLFLMSLIPGLFLVRFKKDPDAALYSFMKNGGVAAAISIFFLGPQATLLISIKLLIDVFVILIIGRFAIGRTHN